MDGIGYKDMPVGMVANGSPAFAHTLRQFVSNGSNIDETYPTFSRMSFISTYGNFKYCVKNVIDDYLSELKDMSVIVKFNDKEAAKYNYKPKLLSLDVYGITDLYYLILLLNGMIDVKEFHGIKYVRLVPTAQLKEAFAAIFKNEVSGIIAYNSMHEHK